MGKKKEGEGEKEKGKEEEKEKGKEEEKEKGKGRLLFRILATDDMEECGDKDTDCLESYVVDEEEDASISIDGTNLNGECADCDAGDEENDTSSDNDSTSSST